MRNYELAYIVDPDLDEDALKELEEKVASWIEAAGGKPGQVDRWGKRRLAYPINKNPEGYYIFLSFEMPPNAGTLIERDLRLSEPIMRYMITLQEPKT
jgi:small subunit ribosomal protein S6